VAQAIEYLLSNRKALSSNPSSTKRKKRKRNLKPNMMVCACNTSTGEVGARRPRVQSQLKLYNKTLSQEIIFLITDSIISAIKKMLYYLGLV
jgi:hypothetical protein